MSNLPHDATPAADPPTTPVTDEVVRAFVEHWGVMARSWGINATMGELFALMFITGGDWTADDLRERLRISRGNVSMNLRELMAWGVVQKVHRRGERREFYRVEGDVWTLFRHIFSERKRRELDPTIRVLDQTARQIARHPELRPLTDRVQALRRFFGQIDGLASKLLALESAELDAVLSLIADRPDPAPATPDPA